MIYANEDVLNSKYIQYVKLDLNKKESWTSRIKKSIKRHRFITTIVITTITLVLINIFLISSFFIIISNV